MQLALAFLFSGLLPASPQVAPPELVLTELSIKHRATKDLPPMNKIVRVALPKGWTGDPENNSRSIFLFGPKGEGEIFVGLASHPSQLGVFLQRLKKRHPGSVPSPPSAIDVHGIKPHRGERATRFQITGRENGEIVTIERGEVIVMIATFVSPNDWIRLQPVLTAAYPSVAVTDIPNVSNRKRAEQ